MESPHRNLLVTGAAGFIGSNFCHYWASKYPNDNIVALDKLTYAGNRHNLEIHDSSSKFLFVEGDINNIDHVRGILLSWHIDTIVHFAAESHVDQSITDPDKFIRTNILGTHSLLKAAKEIWLDGPLPLPHRFHHISTDEVYGTLGPDDEPFSEHTPYAPNSPYAASKASSDHLVRAYHHTYGLNTTISNCSNNYGPFHFPEKLIPQTIINILLGKNIPIYGNGQQIRDWLHVDDHCRGIELILNNDKVGENYNIGGLNEWKNIDVVQLICNTINTIFEEHPFLSEQFPNCPAALNMRTQLLIQWVDDRPGHDTRYSINPQKINKELGFTPVTDFVHGIADTLEWYINNEDWWRKLK
jgi:dTDP-glucose 4,6-dehydratase